MSTAIPSSLREASPSSRSRAGWLRSPWRPKRDVEPTIRFRLRALALSVAIPAALILLAGSIATWQAGRGATDNALINRAESVARAVERELQLSRTALEVLATSPHLESGDLDAFREQIGRLSRPEGSRVTLADAQGLVRVSSAFPSGTPPQMRGNLEMLRRIFATGEPSVSDLYVGKMTGELTVATDVPVRDRDGRIIYALSIAFRPDMLGRLLREQRLPPNWTATLIDRQSVILARTADEGKFVGQRVNAVALAAINSDQNPVVTKSQDGQTIRGAHAPVPWAGWRVAVVVRKSALDAPLWDSLILASLGGGLLLLFGLLAAAGHASRIARPLGALAAGAEALGQGEPLPPVPAGVREASRAGAVLGRAAAELARRNGEREDAERRRGLLTSELNHRVKNVLATVQATAAQTLRGAGGDPQRFAEAFNARLRALARAHDLLTANDWEGAELGEVVRIALAPWLALSAGEAVVSVSCGCGTTLPLRPQQAQALVLALHELATNAAKHGALSRPGGRVAVRCGSGANGTATLEWEESGGPPISGPPERRGFGTRLIERGLARDLGPGAAVSLFFEPAGLRGTMHFALRGAANGPCPARNDCAAA